MVNNVQALARRMMLATWDSHMGLEVNGESKPQRQTHDNYRHMWRPSLQSGKQSTQCWVPLHSQGKCWENILRADQYQRMTPPLLLPKMLSTLPKVHTPKASQADAGAPKQENFKFKAILGSCTFQSSSRYRKILSHRANTSQT